MGLRYQLKTLPSVTLGGTPGTNTQGFGTPSSVLRPWHVNCISAATEEQTSNAKRVSKAGSAGNRIIGAE